MKYSLYISLVVLISCFQNCGPVSFSASQGLDSGGNVTAFGNPNALPGNPDASSPITAPEQMNLICNFQGATKTNWDITPAATNLPNVTISSQSSGADIPNANNVDIFGSSGKNFIVKNAEILKEFSNNSGNLIANVRSVGMINGDSGSIDLNSNDVGDILNFSADHLCVTAHSIQSLAHFSSGNVAISSSGATGSLSEISSSSSGKLAIINMNINSISAGSGNIYIQGGHIKLIAHVSGDIYLDNVTVDQLSASSSKVYLLNGAKVLTRD